MIVADPPVTDAEVCGACEKVRPARSIRQCTRARADEILARGYCMCPPVAQEAPGGLATLSPETQAIYQELVDMSQEMPVAEPEEPAEDFPAPETTVDLIAIEEEPPGTALEVAKKPARRKKDRKRRRTVKVVQLQPVEDPSGAAPVWTHPAEAPTAGYAPTPVIDGGGLVTGPQVIPKE